MSIAERLAEKLEADADELYGRIRAALDLGNLPAALAAVREAHGVTEAQAAQLEGRASMLQRRRASLESGSRWRNDEPEYVEW